MEFKIGNITKVMNFETLFCTCESVEKNPWTKNYVTYMYRVKD